MAIPIHILHRDDVFFGIPPLKVRSGLLLLSRIEARDPTVLDPLYTKNPLDKFFFTDEPNRIFGTEWGLAREGRIDNADCILVSGTSQGVAWGPFLQAGLVPLAHSHPFHRNSPTTTRALAGGGVQWDDINGRNVNQDTHKRLLVFPSAGDVAFCARNGLATHIVKTPYCSVLAPGRIRWIVNFDASSNFGNAPRLSFRIFDVREINQGHYRCCLVAMENNTDFWRKHDVNVFGGGGGGLVL